MDGQTAATTASAGAGAGAMAADPAAVVSTGVSGHVWSSASTAYEALALARAALNNSSSSSEGSAALTRASFAALLASLHTAAVGYHAHLVPHTSERHERLIHERSRLHVSRVQVVHALAQGFGMPLRGSRDGVDLPASASASASTASVHGAARQPLPRALTEQLYSALVQLHPTRPANPPSLPSTQMKKSLSPLASEGIPRGISLPILTPSPRTSPALATLALNTLSNVISSPARSLFALEVFAEHFDLDRGGSGVAGVGGSGGGGAGVVGTASGAAGVTSPSVAVSPAVMPPETADGGRAVSVIMIGGTVLVVDIELGVKEWVPPAATTTDADMEDTVDSIPAWAKQTGQLAWLPTVHVKITFANDTSATVENNPQGGTEGNPTSNGNGTTASAGGAGTSTSELLAASLQRHLLVMAQILLLGFPLSLELEDDDGVGKRTDAGPGSGDGDGDVSMQGVTERPAQPSTTTSASIPEPSKPQLDPPSPSQHESYTTALRTALRPRPCPESLDPGLRLVHTDLYGEEYYLLAHHHLRAVVLVLGRLAQLDRERSAGTSAG